MTRLIRPIQAFLHKLGIRFNIFIDDGRICAKSNDECFYKAQTVLLMFQLAGWNIQWLKTSQEPSQGLKYQGFITDTVQMKYWLDDKKLTEILKVKIDCFTRFGSCLGENSSDMSVTRPHSEHHDVFVPTSVGESGGIEQRLG